MFRFSELIDAAKGKLIQKGSCNNFKNFSIDSRNIQKQSIFLALKGNNFDGHNFIAEAVKNGALCIIKEKSFKVDISSKVSVIEVCDSIKALGFIAAYIRNKFTGPVITITGSNGKTTTKEMIYSVLSSKFKVLRNEGTKNNHIGVPLTLLNLDSSYDVAVLEIGTNHFGEIAYLANICKPNLAVINNIGASHLEHFKSLNGVLKEKYSLVKYFKKPKILLLNADDKLLKNKINNKQDGVFKVTYGIKNNKADFCASEIKDLFGKFIFSVNSHKLVLKTLGFNNIYNALAAAGVARMFGIDYKNIQQSLENFIFPKGRLNITKLNNVTFIDDTYNANPLSLKQAMDALGKVKNKGKKVFVMGDMFELGTKTKEFHIQAGKQVNNVCDYFLTIGKHSFFAAKAAIDSGFNRDNIFSCDSCEQIKDILFKKLLLKQDDIVLVKASRGMKLDKLFEK